MITAQEHLGSLLYNWGNCSCCSSFSRPCLRPPVDSSLLGPLLLHPGAHQAVMPLAGSLPNQANLELAASVLKQAHTQLAGPLLSQATTQPAASVPCLEDQVHGGGPGVCLGAAPHTCLRHYVTA